MDDDSFLKKAAGGITVIAHLSVLNAAGIAYEQERLGLGGVIWSAVSEETCQAPDCEVDVFTVPRLRIEIGTSSTSDAPDMLKTIETAVLST